MAFAGLIALAGLVAGIIGVFSWVSISAELANAPAIVAVPQLIPISVQTIGGFLIFTIALIGGLILEETRSIRRLLQIDWTDADARKAAASAAPRAGRLLEIILTVLALIVVLMVLNAQRH